jgi:dihydrofolate reductase
MTSLPSHSSSPDTSKVVQRGAEAGHWTIVVALAENGVIGRAEQLPWRLSSDLKRFKSLTMGHCLLMGRKTFQSIGKALPGRQTIVLSRQSQLKAAEGVQVTDSLDKVAGLVEPGRAVMVVGGAELYRAALDYCDQMWVTLVKANVEGDTYFPAMDWSQWEMQTRESIPAGAHDQLPTEFQKWCRVKS